MSGTWRYVRRVPLTFTEVLDPAAELDAMAQFLCAHEWPFHGTPRLTPTEVVDMTFGPPDVATFWIGCEGERVGLLRLLDLADLADGSPLFDLRIAASRRGQGIGRAAVTWLTTHLFTSAPALHRIEATTRFDNAGMRRVLVRCGYRLEGQLREAWPDPEGTRHDTMIYGILRREWAELPELR